MMHRPPFAAHPSMHPDHKGTWIVAFEDRAMPKPGKRTDDDDPFGFPMEALAQLYADELNRVHYEYLLGQTYGAIVDALENREHSWRDAADIYRNAHPDMAKTMDANADAIALLRNLVHGQGIDKILELIPGYTPMLLPPLREGDPG